MTRILYIDDEPDIREVACMALELDSDFEVRSCASAREALPVAQEWQPSLILLDVMMPEIDGPTTLRMLRTDPCTYDIPVVFITACAQVGETDKLLALGVTGVLTKPFDPMSLADQVRRFL
jgi:CheY-like chemotaxis protein